MPILLGLLANSQGALPSGLSFVGPPDLAWLHTLADGFIILACVTVAIYLGCVRSKRQTAPGRLALPRRDGNFLPHDKHLAHAQIMERQRLLFDAAFAIQWTNSPEGEMRGEQPSWGNYTGQSYDTYQRYGWADAIHPEDREHTVRLWQEAVNKRSLFDCEHRVRRRDGVYRSFTVRGVPVINAEDQVIEWVGVHSDIDDRKKTEEQRVQLLVRKEAEATLHAANHQLQLANNQLSEKSRQLFDANADLHKSDELFRLLIDALQEGVVVADPEGVILHSNPMAAKMLGVATIRGELSQWAQSDSMYLTDGVTPCPFSDLPLTRAIQGSDVDAVELLHRSVKTPEGILLSIVGKALRDPNGAVVAGMAVMVDITERRRAETVLREAMSAAEAANRAKSDFLANMSHEIRTPMNALIGMSDLLADTELDPEQTKYLSICRNAGRQLLAVIDDILDFSKVEAGQLVLETIDFDLPTFLEATLEMVKERVQQKKIELLFHPAANLPEGVLGDPHRLRQILLNLLSNALKFTASGGTVSLRAERLGEGFNFVQFCVTDTGVGIDPRKIGIIFDSFAQADTSTTRKYGGTGLGLSISKRLTELMGGSISVASTLGEGSAFCFKVPLPASKKPVAKAATDEISLRDLCVLIVDSDPTHRLMIKALCEQWGAKASEAADGYTALASIKVSCAAQTPHQIIFVDRHLPDIDSFDLLENIRANCGDLADTTTVLLASALNREELQRCSALNITAHMSKPIVQRQLWDTLQRALHLTRRRQEVASKASTEKIFHILVAEDTEDNWFLIEVYLRDQPYRLVFAADGAAAVKTFTEQHFDLVLMDVQLPILDGYEATRRIRVWEQGQGKLRTPILALTANAFKGDVTQTLAAGCDAHLSKPIKKDVLLQEISRWLLSPPITVTVDKDLQGLIPNFLKNRETNVGELRAALHRKDFDALKATGHILKGVGSTFGFNEITAIGIAIELAASQRSCTKVAYQIDTLQRYLERIVIAFC